MRNPVRRAASTTLPSKNQNSACRRSLRLVPVEEEDADDSDSGSSLGSLIRLAGRVSGEADMVEQSQEIEKEVSDARIHPAKSCCLCQSTRGRVLHRDTASPRLVPIVLCTALGNLDAAGQPRSSNLVWVFLTTPFLLTYCQPSVCGLESISSYINVYHP